MRRIADLDAVVVPVRRVEALAAVEVADPLDARREVLRAVLVVAAHVLHRVLQVDVERAVVGFAECARGAGADRERAHQLVVVVHGGRLRGLVHHDAHRGLLLLGLERSHIEFRGDQPAVARFERLKHLRRRRVGVLHGHAVHAVHARQQHVAGVVDDVRLVDLLLVELLGQFGSQVVLDGLFVIGQGDGAVLHVAGRLDPRRHRVVRQFEVAVAIVGEHDLVVEPLVGVRGGLVGGVHADGHVHVRVVDLHARPRARGLDGVGDGLVHGVQLRRPPHLAFGDRERLRSGIIGDRGGYGLLVVGHEAVGQERVRRVFVVLGAQADLGSGERVEPGEVGQQRVHAGRVPVGFGVEQRVHGRIHVHAHAEFLQRGLDLLSVRVGNGQSRIGDRARYRIGQAIAVLPRHADLAERHAGRGLVGEIPARGEQAGHGQHQQRADDAERDDPRQFGVPRLLLVAGQSDGVLAHGHRGRVSDRWHGHGTVVVHRRETIHLIVVGHCHSLTNSHSFQGITIRRRTDYSARPYHSSIMYRAMAVRFGALIVPLTSSAVYSSRLTQRASTVSCPSVRMSVFSA